MNPNPENPGDRRVTSVTRVAACLAGLAVVAPSEAAAAGLDVVASSAGVALGALGVAVALLPALRKLRSEADAREATLVASQAEIARLRRDLERREQEASRAAAARDAAREAEAAVIGEAAEPGPARADEVTFDPLALAEEVIAAAAPGAAARGIEVDTAADDALPVALRGDAERIRQALRLLVGHAVAATTRGAVLLGVRCATSDATTNAVTLELTLHDGSGTTDAAMSATSPTAGTDAGLQVVRRMVHVLGGTLASGQASAGPMFRLDVPLRAVADAGTHAADASPVPGDPVVLVIDADAARRHRLVERCEAAGFVTRGAGGALEAIGKLRTMPTAGTTLILADADAFAAGGADLARRLRAVGGPREARVVALSANEIARDALPAGVDANLVRPLRRSTLPRTLRNAAGGRPHAADRVTGHESVAPHLPTPAASEPPQAERAAPSDEAQPLPIFDPSPLIPLREASPDDDDLVRRIVGIFLRTTPPLLDAIERAANDGDADTISLHAHSLKASGAQVGALRFGALAASMEIAARAGALPDGPRMTSQLRAAFRHAAHALRAHIPALANEPTEPADSGALAREAATETVPEPSADADTQTVMVIDDDAVMRASIRELLTLAGYRVVVASSGAQALELLRTEMPALVMLDLVMPDMDGFVVCERLRAMPGHDLVPVLVMTGLDDYQSVDRAYEAGATDFIAKPLQWSILTHRVRFLIRSGTALGELKRAEARNRALLEAVPDTLVALSRTGTFRTFKPGAGWDARAVGIYEGRKLGEVFTEEIASRSGEAIERALANKTVESVEVQIPHGEEMRDFEARIAPSGAGEVIALVRDVTGRKRHEERIRKLAYFDPLTGLPNRVLFQDRLAAAIGQAKRHERRIALLFVDLDRFKAVNDSLGHRAGDELLREAARRLGECVRATDSVARAIDHDETDPTVLSRWAGDEFTVLLQEVQGAPDARRVAQRILERFGEPFMIEGREIVIGASIGIAVYPDNGTDPATLLRNADSAMYNAKGEGRNTFRYYSQSMSETALDRLEIEAELRHAVEAGQFVLHYQPKIELASRRVIGAEALVRWQHPVRGLVPPAVFIGIAEENGTIRTLGRWVLEEACRAAVGWKDAGFGDATIAVNVSAHQVRDPGFAKVVGEVLARTGLPPARLELELTETVLLQDDETSIEMLHALNALGVRIAIDDFGTGYSSLSYLQRFPLDTLKIDRSFVSKAKEAPDSLAIVRTIIAMGESLGLGVVAEGVETEADIALLADLRCPVGQGYGIAKPLPPSELVAFMRAAREWAETPHIPLVG
jgi:diguanylate cyclase (GGDEF)-like protein